MSKWLDLENNLKNVDHILIVAHYNPDGDAISSTLAVGRILQQLGKKFTMANESKVPNRFLFLENAEQIYLSTEIENTFSYIITVDCADIDRVGKSRLLFAENAQIVNIDHHKTNDHFGLLNFVDISAASTTQVIYDWIISTNKQIDVPLATMLYTGLLTDTGGFKHSNTTAKVLRISADLIEIGVDPYEISDKAIESISPQYIHLLQKALSSLWLSDDGQVAAILLSYGDLEPFLEVDLEGIVQYTRNIIGVEVGMFLRETEPGFIKISFRSKEYFDVARFAQRFGGGGHARASGCTVEGTVEQVHSLVMEKLTKELEQKTI